MGACLRSKLPTIGAVHLLLAPALIFIAACLDRQYQTDFWHHLARGEQIVRAGRILDVDVFTYTVTGQPLRDANWLTQVIYWRLFSWGGLDCVQVANAGLLAIALLVLVRVCLRDAEDTPAERGANGNAVRSRAAAIAGAGVFLGLCPFALIRPQTGSFLLFVLLLAVLLDRKRRPWAMWLAVPILAVWANIHGGFAIGLLLIGAFVLEAGLPVILYVRAGGEKGTFAAAQRDFARLVLLLALSIAATCFNPYGWTIYQYAATLTARAAGRGIEEWLPPTLASTAGWVLIVWLTALGGLAAVGRRRPTTLQVCLLICFVPPACRSVRMIPWLLLATAPMMAQMLEAAGRRREEARGPDESSDIAQPSFSAAILIVILLGAAAMSLPWLQNVNPLFGSVRSSHRVEDDLQSATLQMHARGPGRVFSRLEWGDYLSFSAHAGNPIFCDGRIELYPDSTWAQYLQISAGGPNSLAILDRWGVDYLVLDAHYHATLLKRIGRNGSWKTVWRSGQVVLLTRSAPRFVGGSGHNSPLNLVANTR